jgi:hypothetical protein
VDILTIPPGCFWEKKKNNRGLSLYILPEDIPIHVACLPGHPLQVILLPDPSFRGHRPGFPSHN